MDEDERNPEDTEEQEEQQDALAAFWAYVEVAALSIFARRIFAIDEKTTAVDIAVGASDAMAEFHEFISMALRQGKAQVADILEEMAHLNDLWAAKFYEAASVAMKKIGDNLRTTPKFKDGLRESYDVLNDIVDTSVMRLIAPDGSSVDIRNAYLAACNNAVASIRAGEAPEVATRRAVKKLSSGGIRVAYKSGATRELYTAVSMNVMDTYRATLANIRDTQADEFGADGVQVSAHSMCAPDHLPYQGRQFTRDEFERIQNGLGRKIAGGLNCRHTVSRVILGVGEVSAKKRAQIRRTSTRKVKNPDGGTMTAYEFTQWQRAEETAIRKLRMKAQILENGGDSAGADEYRRRIAAKKRNYSDWSNTNGVPTRYQRMEVYDWKN